MEGRLTLNVSSASDELATRKDGFMSFGFTLQKALGPAFYRKMAGARISTHRNLHIGVIAQL